MANKPRTTRVVLAPKGTGLVSRAAIRRAVEKVGVELWQEKLGDLQAKEAHTSDPRERSALRKQIEEARAKIEQLDG